MTMTARGYDDDGTQMVELTIEGHVFFLIGWEAESLRELIDGALYEAAAPERDRQRAALLAIPHAAIMVGSDLIALREDRDGVLHQTYAGRDTRPLLARFPLPEKFESVDAVRQYLRQWDRYIDEEQSP